MYESVKDHSPVLDAIRAFLPDVEAAYGETESNRGISLEIAEKMRSAGMFRMMMSKSLGGEEMSLLQVMRVVEELARADGSAGWTAMVAGGFNAFLSLFPVETIKEIVGTTGNIMMRGAAAPKGRIVAVDGGYRISGQWPFGSGNYPHEWIMASGIVFDGPAPKMGANGMPEIVLCIVPASEATFLDTWDVYGMSGSASHDFVIDDVFVPAVRTASLFSPSNSELPMLRLPFPVITGTQHTAVSTGVALGALDDLARLAQTKRPAFRPQLTLKEDPVFVARFGELVTRLDVARTSAKWQAEELMEMASMGRPLTPAEVARHTAMIAYVSREAVAVVNDAFDLAGGTAVYRSCRLEQRLRDVRVAAQHAAASLDSYDKLGAPLLADPAQLVAA